MPSCTDSNPSHNFVLVHPMCHNDDRARETGPTIHFMTRHDLVLANNSTLAGQWTHNGPNNQTHCGFRSSPASDRANRSRLKELTVKR
jgi:hypothetical protein